MDGQKGIRLAGYQQFQLALSARYTVEGVVTIEDSEKPLQIGRAL
jgi:hypothetical protein